MQGPDAAVKSKVATCNQTDTFGSQLVSSKLLNKLPGIYNRKKKNNGAGIPITWSVSIIIFSRYIFRGPRLARNPEGKYILRLLKTADTAVVLHSTSFKIHVSFVIAVSSLLQPLHRVKVQ